MSPGRCADAEGMFSTKPQIPTALTLALRPASALISPITTPAPPMSYFMSSIWSAGLIEMPPLSKVTPLPTKAIGPLPLDLAAPFQRMTSNWDSFAEPWPTPSSAPMPSLCISFLPSTWIFRPSFVSLRASATKDLG